MVPEKDAKVPKMNFSCVVEPPAKGNARGSRLGAPAAPASVPAPRVAEIVKPVAAAPVPVPPAPQAAPAPVPPVPGQTAPAVAATTLPPFGMGAEPDPSAESVAPFNPLDAVQKEFAPPPRPKTRLLTGSVFILLVAGVAGYFQFQRVQKAQAEAAKAAEIAAATARAAAAANPVAGSPANAAASKAAPPNSLVGGAPLGGMPTPFSALKQAKETLKDAGDRQKAAHDAVESLLNDPVGKAPTPGASTSGATSAKAGASAGPAVTVAASSAGAALVPGARLTDVRGELIVVDTTKPPPTRNFLVWATTVRISGVRTGENPRVMIGGSPFEPGDTVDARRGVVFVGYEPETQQLRFSEQSGAQVLLRR